MKIRKFADLIKGQIANITQMRNVLRIWLLPVALLLSGCSTSGTKPEVKFVSVPSSKPYRYLKYTAQCDASTISRIKVHNETHWRVKQAEAKAAE